MATYANNLRSLAAMIEAEREIENISFSKTHAWALDFLLALVPAGTTAITPDTARAQATKDSFDDAAILAVALAAWRRRYKKKRKAGYSQAQEARFAAEVRDVTQLIPERSFQIAEKVISEGVKAGLSAKDIHTNVMKAVLDAVPTTAKRTGQLLGPSAINDATLAAMDDAQRIDGAGPFVKSWVSLLDGRVRDSHLEAHANPQNQRIPLDSKFVVGDELANRPRDPSLSLEESAGCRCIASVEDA